MTAVMAPVVVPPATESAPVGNYSLRAVLTKSPNTIANAVFVLVNLIAGVIAYASGLEEVSMGLLALFGQGEVALSVLLNLLIIQPNTVVADTAAAQTEVVATQRAQQAAAETKSAIVDFLAEAVPEQADVELVADVIAETPPPSPSTKPRRPPKKAG
jgi:hypothetical protein